MRDKYNLGACLTVVHSASRSAKGRYRITGLRRIFADAALVWWLGAVHVVGVIQLSRSSQASSWLEHQEEFAGLTCIGYRLSLGCNDVLSCITLGCRTSPSYTVTGL